MTKRLLLVVGLLLGTVTYASTTVPFDARMDAELQFLGPCGPTCVNARMSGVGQALHAGRTTMDGPVQIDWFSGSQTGTPTFTAADGSTLTLSVTAVFTPTSTGFTLLGTWTATGGTGRFEGATGSGTLDGSGSNSGAFVHFAGTLSDPGQF